MSVAVQCSSPQTIKGSSGTRRARKAGNERKSYTCKAEAGRQTDDGEREGNLPGGVAIWPSPLPPDSGYAARKVGVV